MTGLTTRSAWKSLTAPCADGEGEHPFCTLGVPAQVETETLIIHGGDDDGRFTRTYEVWHEAKPPVDCVLAGKVHADADTLQLIERIQSVVDQLTRGPDIDERTVALVLAAYEHLREDENYARARFTYGSYGYRGEV